MLAQNSAKQITKNYYLCYKHCKLIFGVKVSLPIVIIFEQHWDTIPQTESTDIEDIQRRVSAVGVKTHSISLEGRRYLVIPNVNTSDIAERIRKIPS